MEERQREQEKEEKMTPIDHWRTLDKISLYLHINKTIRHHHMSILKTSSEDLYLFMEDHDDWGLPTHERREQLEDAAIEFNERNGTKFVPRIAYTNYEHRRRREGDNE